MLGALSRAICYTVGYLIVRLWTKLVSFWCKSSNLQYANLDMFVAWFNCNLPLFWIVLLPIDIFSVWYTPGCFKNGCVNTLVSCVNRSLQGTTLIINLAVGISSVVYLRSAFLILRDEGTAALFKTVSHQSMSSVSTAPYGHSSNKSLHILDADVPSIFALGKRASLTLDSPCNNTEDKTPCENRPSSSDKYRRSNLELSNSLISTTTISLSSDTDGDFQDALGGENSSIEEMMRRQTIRICGYILMVFVLTFGVITYDIRFCTVNNINEILYHSPPCGSYQILKESVGLNYKGESISSLAHAYYVIVDDSVFLCVECCIPPLSQTKCL